MWNSWRIVFYGVERLEDIRGPPGAEREGWLGRTCTMYSRPVSRTATDIDFDLDQQCVVNPVCGLQLSMCFSCEA